MFCYLGKKSDNPLSPDYVPSIFKYTTSPDRRRLKRKLVKFERTQAMKKKRIEQQDRVDAAKALIHLCSQSDKVVETGFMKIEVDSGEEQGSKIETESQTDLTMTNIEEAHNYTLQIQMDNYKLREITSNNSLELESFDDEKVKYYTGLPNRKVLDVVLEYIKTDLSEIKILSRFHQVLLTLMRMRLNLHNQDLAYRFGVHPSTVSRTFHNVLGILYMKMVPLLVFWPEREQLKQSMPMCFRNSFPKCTVIIDCFEIFIEKSTDQLARAQTYSSYKSHNTIKYLIGIAPQGVITFISKGWRGRTSDKHITENAGFLKHLLPGDVVLAD